LRYRLYLDESGDHTYPVAPSAQSSARYLALIGVWLARAGPTYTTFAADLEALKRRHFHHDPDDPVVLHRKNIMQAKGPFWPLRDPTRRQAFDQDLLQFIARHDFLTVGVVIDKVAHRQQYGSAAFHPYHYCLDAVLERYCGYLRYLGHTGDVMAEGRGRVENMELQQAYEATYQHGTFVGYFKAAVMQATLTSKEIKIKPKAANVPGLQLADLLASAVKKDVLADYGIWPRTQDFDAEIAQVLRSQSKYNRHLWTGRIRGYGMVLL
jgi:hypothetical protein